MSNIYLFEIASQRGSWLAARQSVVAGNIANANTPGFEARDVEPFEATLDSTRLELARTRPQHLGHATAGRPDAQTVKQRPWDVLHSGNTVSLEQELMKAAEVKSSFSLNTAVMKAFHRMILASAKG